MTPESAGGIEARARRAAERICAETRAWSRQLGNSIGRPDMETEIFREVLSFALHVAESRDAERLALCPEGFHRALRVECVALFLQWTERLEVSRKSLAGPEPQVTGMSLPVWRERQRPDKEAFEAFCRATGLGSDVLVGREDNLAGLVFYIVIFSLYDRGSILSGAQAQRLLRCLQDCRVHLARSAPGWLEEVGGGLTLRPPMQSTMRQIENAILL